LGEKETSNLFVHEQSQAAGWQGGKIGIGSGRIKSQQQTGKKREGESHEIERKRNSHYCPGGEV